MAGEGSVSGGWTPFELSLNALDTVGKNKSKAIVEYRYGLDNAPGKKDVDDDKDNFILSEDGIDNDADGEIDEKNEGVDEPDEFCPDNPLGDDNPFETMPEIRLVSGIGEYTYNRIKDYITIYSYDKNIDREGNLRLNINFASPAQLAQALIKSGFSEDRAVQIAVNIVDFRDEDNVPTEYKGKYGIEATPYINEVMPNFTSSVNTAVSDLTKGGIKYLKDKAEEKVREKIKEKIKGDIPGLDGILDEIIGVGEKKLDKIIDRYKKEQSLQFKKNNPSLFTLFETRTAFAEESDSVKMEIQIEWVELYNPYPLTISASGWRIKTSLRERRVLGVVSSRGYWVVFNVVIKISGETIGKELMGNFTDTVQLINKNGQVVDEVTYYNYGVPWRAWEKNDPRMREFVGFMPGGSPWHSNWYWMPRIGEVDPEEAFSSFYVKNKSFSSIGEIGYIHSAKQWCTINLDKAGEWSILDKITTAYPPQKSVKGKVNINTASQKVLESLPEIDSKIAGQIISYCDGKDGPFDEIGEITEVIGMQKLGANGWDDDRDGYVDEDDEKEAILRGISNLITVRSMCFTIVSLGRVVEDGKMIAEKKIKVVVDRDLPVRIRYYRQIYQDE